MSEPSDADLLAAEESLSAPLASQPPRSTATGTSATTGTPVGTPSAETPSARPGIVQPIPQAAAPRTAAASSGASIIVSPRQRGNPVLTFIKSQPWEYGEGPADYVMGATTCALFLSLKYHRLHPEYIYTRIRNLQGKYGLRILLTMVDISNHEEALRELSKTSVVNNVTVMLCWSAAEAARYLELFKSYEHAGFGAIMGQQTSSYAERLVDFVTVPRKINKADAVALVSTFGSLRNAVNADADEVGAIGGWGGTKVKRWCAAVQEPFRARSAAVRRGNPVYEPGGGGLDSRVRRGSDDGQEYDRPKNDGPKEDGQRDNGLRDGGQKDDDQKDDTGKDGPEPPLPSKTGARDDGTDQAQSDGAPGLAPGIAAALARLRRQEG